MTTKKTTTTKKTPAEAVNVLDAPPITMSEAELTALLDRVRTEVRAEFRQASQVTPPKSPIEVERGVIRDGKQYTVRKYADGHERWDRTDFDLEFARTMLRGKGRGLS